jgi:hypothetical protein
MEGSIVIGPDMGGGFWSLPFSERLKDFIALGDGRGDLR